jgi:hypothetical protein
MDDENDVERPRRPTEIVATDTSWSSGRLRLPQQLRDAYGDFLDGVNNCMRRRCRSHQVLILGDVNARFSQWGDTRTNTRGRMLSDWAAGLGLLLTNRGSTNTCVAWRESFVVDVTWTTASLHRRMRNWRVAEEVEILSDHLYIMIEQTSEIASTGRDRRNTRGPSRSRPPPTPRWRRALQQEIQNAKARSWMELVESVESDPWGRPYRLVTKKLRPPAPPPLTANMEPGLHANQDFVPTAAGQQGHWQHEADTILPPQRNHGVERRATSHPRGALRNNKKDDITPGPDGIPGRVWAESMKTLAPRLQSLFTRCLREEVYPRAWRTVRLILLNKEGRPSDFVRVQADKLLLTRWANYSKV